jgi:hypothetical protein
MTHNDVLNSKGSISHEEALKSPRRIWQIYAKSFNSGWKRLFRNYEYRIKRNR